jgi:ribosomal protein S18 acetylase RimI-like enzyme
MSSSLRLIPASQATAVQLLELAADLRRSLAERGERLANSWPEELVEDLRRSQLDGVVLEGSRGPETLGILSLRPHRAFGQVHLSGAARPVAEAEETLLALIARLPPTSKRLDLGVTGLTPDEEEALGRSMAARPGFEIIRRFGMTREIDLAHPPEPIALPAGVRYRPVRELGIGPLAQSDWDAFRGTADASLFSDTLEGNTRLLQGILDGELGRFLDESSVALDEGGRTLGFALVVEESPKVGVLVDLAVAPTERRRGLGRLLMTRILRALVALGYARVRLWVTEGNRPARALYKSFGFRTDMTALIYSWRRAAAGATPPSPQ